MIVPNTFIMPNHYTRTIPELTDTERSDLQRWCEAEKLHNLLH